MLSWRCIWGWPPIASFHNPLAFTVHHRRKYFTNHVPSVVVADDAGKDSLNVPQGRNLSLQLESEMCLR